MKMESIASIIVTSMSVIAARMKDVAPAAGTQKELDRLRTS